MKYERAFGRERDVVSPKSAMASLTRFLPQPKSHAPCQVGVTALTIGTSVVSFWCVSMLPDKLLRLRENYEGPISNLEDLPCARRTFAECSGELTDSCSSSCCPEGYICMRGTTVGVYCQAILTPCADFPFCFGVADLQGTCEEQSCKDRLMVERITGVVYVVAAAGVILDLVDMIACVALADSVLLKSVVDLLAALVKLLAFGLIIGVGTGDYLADLTDRGCFNEDGSLTAQSAHEFFAGGTSALFCSFVLSLCLAPISAFYGGRLTDRPKYTIHAMTIGA